MGQEKLYIEKELSWLAFNERVLQEAADKSNPLIERMRFLGIYSNNLDEFYKVRFAELKRRIIISEEQGLNSHSRHLLGKIQSRVMKADQEFDGLYNELLLEMPFYAWPSSLWDTLFALCERQDVRIVLAHADRYPRENIERLIREGIPLQLNAVCLTKPIKRRRYLEWIQNGYVKYLGSDIHMLGDGYRDWKKCKTLLEKKLR